MHLGEDLAVFQTETRNGVGHDLVGLGNARHELGVLLATLGQECAPIERLPRQELRFALLAGLGIAETGFELAVHLVDRADEQLGAGLTQRPPQIFTDIVPFAGPMPETGRKAAKQDAGQEKVQPDRNDNRKRQKLRPTWTGKHQPPPRRPRAISQYYR
nr:hypothetical protein [Rhodoplanes sp. Z2-YC6860]